MNRSECRSFELETFTQLCKFSKCNSIFRAQRNAERQASQSCYTSSQRRACGGRDQHQKRKDLDNSIKTMVRCRPNVIDVEWYFEYITKLKSLAKTVLMIGFVHYFVCNRSSCSGRIQHKFQAKALILAGLPLPVSRHPQKHAQTANKFLPLLAIHSTSIHLHLK
jgi:hypothetical protein